MLDRITRIKPKDFEPTFTAHVIRNRQWLFPCYFATFVIAAMTLDHFIKERIFEFTIGLLAMPFIAYLADRNRHLSNNPNIIEVNDTGVWLEQNNLFIPKNRILEIKQNEDTTIMPPYFISIKRQNIGIIVKVKQSEQKRLFKYTWFMQKGYEDNTYKHILLIVPYTSGTMDEIGLNITKPNLIGKLNQLIE